MKNFVVKCIMLAATLLVFGEWTTVCAETIGARNSKEPSTQTVYECQKTDEKITVDGVLDEDVWRRTPSMSFVGIVDGSKPPFLTEAKMLWDDKYLYVGYYFEEPDVRAYWGIEEANCSDALKSIPRGISFSTIASEGKEAWWYTECLIMRVDRFAKLFLDPDGDGTNYIEMQCNPLNNYFDSWYKRGFSKDYHGSRFPSVEWKCPGRLSATRIYGTVNAPQDIDKGWSLEMAIPWTSLAPFTKGACPPVSGDIWGGHLGRVYRDWVGGSNEYWVWPFLGIRNCHFPNLYGKIVFKDELRHFDRFFVWGSPREDETYVKRLAQIGVTDLMGYGTPSPKVAELFAKNNINLYLCVTPGQGWGKKYPGVPMPLQKMTDAESAVKELLNGSKSPHRPGTDKADAPADWTVTDKQKKLLDELGRANYKQQSKYQWGGEKEGMYFGGKCDEVLTEDLPCFSTPEVRELMKDRIKDTLAVPGVRGVAFDYIGYQNYHACFCPICERLYKEYCEREKCNPADAKSRNSFSLSTLVDFNNEMVDYAHSLKADAVVVNHVYPVFMPEPLYGNRLKMDFCGQTAAWYQYWDLWRIQKYSKVIASEQEKYWKGVKGVAFIGYYDRPEFPVKTSAKVEAELRAILRGGSTYLMMCGLDDLLRNPDVCEVFKKFRLPPQKK